jgi:predicted double-glycine peptidase
MADMTFLSYAYKQPNSWTCGPAVVRLILRCFGRKKTIGEVIKELGIGREGTANRDLKRIFRKYDIRFMEKERATLEDIKRRIKNHIIVVAYWIPCHKEAHYSIVQKISAKRVYFHDTWFGSNHSYSIEHFLKNWWDDEATHWFLAVRRPR